MTKDHDPITRAQIMRQIQESHDTMLALAKLFPGCFHADGRPIVAVARMPRLPDTTTKEQSE